MMMEPFQSLKCVPLAARCNARYVGDHVIRHYRPLGLAALLRDLGADPATPELDIIGGIGRLVMHADGSELWEPTINASAAVHPSQTTSDPRLAAARQSICTACHAYTDRCTASGCGCAGEGKPDIWSSRCPLGKWPSIDCNP